MKRSIVEEAHVEPAIKKRNVEKSETYKIKKRKIINRLVGTTESMPEIVTKCQPASGSIKWTCSSRDGCRTHDISAVVDAGKIKFECGCSGGFEDEKTGHCIHIISAVVIMLQNFIDSTLSFQDRKNEYFDAVKRLQRTKIV
jgi:hypothetical protein